MAETRIATIRERLQAAFAPKSLEIIDDSHRHIGHPGAREGRGHFTVRIVSEKFAGVSPLERHRMVYAALGSLLQTDIHAVSVLAHDRENASADGGRSESTEAD